MNQGDYIRGLLKERSITSKEMAKKIGISSTTFSNKIHGYRIFKRHEIEILLRELDMSYEDVFSTKEVQINENDERVVILDGEKQVISKETLETIKTVITCANEVSDEFFKAYKSIDFEKIADGLKKWYDSIDKEEYEKFKKERKERKARKE